MATLNIFPVDARVQQVAVTTASSTSITLPAKGRTIRVVSEGPNTSFISVGPGAQVATVPSTTEGAALSTCTPVLSGEDVIFSIPNDKYYKFAAITKTGTATLYVSVGDGI